MCALTSWSCCTGSPAPRLTGGRCSRGCRRRPQPVAVDRPGYGSSPQAAVGFAGNARAVLAELDARGIGQAVLIGHSYGGGVALAVTSLHAVPRQALVPLGSC